MSVTIRNYPRKPLSEKERTIRETIDRISASGAHPPYVFVSAADASTLQGEINTLTSGTGGVIWLEGGTYNCGNLVIAGTQAIEIRGSGMNSTILTGSITTARGGVVLRDLWVFANTQTYGVKLGAGATSTDRCHLDKVRVGGNADGTGRAPSGDGPQVGLWLDGAILTVCDHCLFAFCNTGSGVYVNSTSGTWSTNCNTFRDCTVNGNKTNGYEIIEGGDGVASMLLHRIIGGNIEDNGTSGVAGTSDIYVRSAIGIEIVGVDFESTKNLGSATIDINATCVVVEDCNFVTTGTTPRAFLMTSGNAVVRYSRSSGTYTARDIGVFADGCVHCHAYGNTWWSAASGSVTTTPRWVSNRGSMFGWSA